MGNIFSIECGDALLGRSWDCIARQSLYICAIEDNLQALKTVTDELQDLRNDLQLTVISQLTPDTVQSNQVQGWCSRVDSAITQVTNLIRRGEEERQKLCIAGCCSKNCMSSYIFGKNLAQSLKQVIDLKAAGANFKDLVINEPGKLLRSDLDTLKTTKEQLSALKEVVEQRITLDEGPEWKPLKPVELWLSMVQKITDEADELIRQGPQEVSKFCAKGFSNFTFLGAVSNKLGAMCTLISEGGFHEVVGRVPSEPNFICKLQDDLRVLKTKKEKLQALKVDLEDSVMSGQGRQYKPLQEVQHWISDAEHIIRAADMLVQDGPQEMEKFRLGDFSNKTFMRSVGRVLSDAIILIDSAHFKQVVRRTLPERVQQRFQEPSVGTRAMLKEAWSCLLSDKVGILGIYGIGGVGKTTLLTEINNKFATTPNNFDVVIFVVVSRDLKIEKIQEDIWKHIGFCDESWLRKSSSDKAKDISFTMERKKFVLLLDDVWQRFDLQHVGVPSPNALQNGSKVVITARSSAVCTDMDAEKMIKVEPLTSEDAWILFQKKVGGIEVDILLLAEQVASECCGLPIALITIGRAMASRRSVEEWEHALKVLKRSNPNSQGMVDEIYQGMEVHVFKRLKFSYDCLPHNIIKSCFLYCSLFPEDFKILKNDLVHYWICENFCTLDGGHSIVGTLIRQSLLEEEEEKYVKMHDVIRDMALWITCKCKEEEEKFFVRAGSHLMEVPVESGEWEGATRVSLMGNSFNNFPAMVNSCCDVVTLFLSHNPNLRIISEDVFPRNDKLKVLDLSETSIEALPLGISEQRFLQYLNLSHTRIRELPMQLNRLKLKYLNLDHTGFLKMIPALLLSSFSELQVLKMFMCGSMKHNYRIGNVLVDGSLLLQELLRLQNLVELSITIRTVYVLQSLCEEPRLLNCTRALVLHQLKVKQNEPLNISSLARASNLNLLLVFGNTYVDEVVLKVTDQASSSSGLTDNQLIFSSLKEVIVSNYNGMRELTWVMLAPNLTILRVTFNDYMEAIVSHEKLREFQAEDGSSHFFSKLQVLELYGLPNLESIYWKTLYFPCLRQIDVYGCPRLKKLPLNSSSATGCKLVIKGEESWWENLEWEDDATKDAFSSCFQKI